MLASHDSRIELNIVQLASTSNDRSSQLGSLSPNRCYEVSCCKYHQVWGVGLARDSREAGNELFQTKGGENGFNFFVI